MPTQNPATGQYIFGDGVTETHTVPAGTVQVLTATNADAEPDLRVGLNGGTGTINIDGTGTVMRLVGTGEMANGPNGIPGARARIGLDGGTGTLNITGGGHFEIVDNSTAAILDPDYFGSEYMAVGRGAGSTGTVNVNGAGSTLSMIGGAPEFQVGRDGGNGTVVFDDHAVFQVTSVTNNDPNADFGTSEAGIQVGRQNGAVGVLTFSNNSTGTMTSGDGAGVYLQAGRDTGTGTFNLLGGSTFTMNGDLGAFFAVGRGGGNGFLNIAAASHLDIHAGDGNADLVIGAFDRNADRRGGGTGQAGVTDSFVALDGAQGAWIRVGQGDWDTRESDGSGTLLADNSSLTVAGAGGNGFGVGIDGGTGFVSLENLSIVTVTSSAGGAQLNIGIGSTDETQADGRVYVEDSAINITGTGTAGAGAEIGADGGLGLLNLDDASLSITSASHTNLNLGLRDGSALVDVSDGSTVTITSTAAADGGVGASIGAFDGGASVTLRGSSTWNLTSVLGGGLNIGTDWQSDGSDSGNGMLSVLGGSHINFQSTGADTGNNLRVGGGDNSEAKVIVSGGSVIDMDQAGGADSWGGVQIGVHGADSASVLVDGIGSRIDHVDYLQIGYDPEDGGSVAGGNGRLTIKNGAVVNADAIHVGAGGVLGGYRGTVNGSHVFLIGGGSIDLRDGLFGTFTIDNLMVGGAGNLLRLDVGSGGRQDTFVFNQFATSPLPIGNLTIDLAAVSGYQFAAGETRTLVDLVGSGVPNFAFSASGQGAGFAFYGGRLASDPASIFFRALNAGSSAASAIATVDFGLAGPAATVTYDSVGNNGLVKGGNVYGTVGGRAYNIDQFLGTDSADSMTVTGATARTLTFNGRGGNDTITGGAGVDTVFGGAGLDTLNGGAGNDVLNGDADNDVLNGGAGLDTLNGGLANDVLNGDADNDTLNGGAGLDTLNGGTGNDTLNGDADNDTLNGSAGLDTLNGGTGADIMRGGADNDIYIVDNPGDVVDELIAGSSGVADLVQSSITFSLADSVHAKGAIEKLTLTGVGAINGTGNGLINTIVGNGAANTLDGGLNNDTLIGNAGNDILIGGLGKDTMTGGLNNDIFRFAATTHSLVGANADVITDFDDSGDDRIDVSALFGPLMAYRHNLAFTAAGQVRINDIAGADLLVEVNTGGSLAADFQIRLTNTTLASMSAADFFL